jgi:CRP-like cAMP-binding protein
MASVDRSLVANLSLFAGMAADELEGVLQEARAVPYTRCSNVFEQGQEAHFFFVLLSGLVRATKTTPTGEQVFMRYVRPGETFGVAVAIGLAQYPATAVALDDSSVLVWPSAAWPRLVAKYPALATNTLHTVGYACKICIRALSTCQRSKSSAALRVY